MHAEGENVPVGQLSSSGQAPAEESFDERLGKKLESAIQEINCLVDADDAGTDSAACANLRSSAQSKDGQTFEEKLKDVIEMLGMVGRTPLRRSTMDDLFRLKDRMIEAGFDIPKQFVSRFVNVVCTYVLNDDDTPGEIDEKEAKWLRSRTLLNGRMDFIDKRLLKVLKSKSLNNPAVLSYKGACSKFIERWLYSFRWFTWTAIIGSLGAAAALFIGGTGTLVNSVFHFFMPHSAISARTEEFLRQIGIVSEANIKDLETLQGSLVTVIDVYLFAMVLLIFGVGIYELFINQIDPVDDKHSNRPSWLHVTCIDDLKASLGKSILMVLIVALYKYALNITAASAGTASVVNLLHFAGVIVLVALSLFLTSLSSHRKNASSNNKKKEGK